MLVDLACETDFVAKSAEFNEAANDIALHISWANPRWVSRDDVRRGRRGEGAGAHRTGGACRRQARAGDPPRSSRDVIEKFYEENVLLEQIFVNKEKFDGTIDDLIVRLGSKMGENISVRRFSRLAVGDEG